MTAEMTSTTSGWIGVVLGIIFFAACVIPYKIRRTQESGISPMLWQFYFAVGIALVTPLILILAELRWTWYGLAAAALWVPANSSAFFVINFIGLAIGVAVWSALSVVVSFCWGFFVFRDPIDSVVMACSGVLLISLGIVGLSLASSGWLEQAMFLKPVYAWIDRRWPTKPHDDAVELSRFDDGRSSDADATGSYVPLQQRDADANAVDGPEGTTSDQLETGGDDGNDDIGASTVERPQTKSTRDFWFGLALSSFIGLTNGSMLVPARLTSCDTQGLFFVFSFGVGVAIVSPILACLYFLILRQKPEFKLRQVFAAGLGAGALWFVGNVGAILAGQNLGLAIGFPLVQCQLVFSGAIGIFWFRELKDKVAIAFWALSVLVVIAGAFLLAGSGGEIPACV